MRARERPVNDKSAARVFTRRLLGGAGLCPIKFEGQFKRLTFEVKDD
jgi:hypothetical protein